MIKYAICFSLVLFSANVYAEDIELTADDRVEWHQNEQKMVAVGNAVAKKADMQLNAGIMTAFYDNSGNKNKDKKGSIKEIHAKDNVIMKSARATALGDALDYKLADDEVILVGKPAKIKTETETITADEKIIYYPSRKQAEAFGNVVAYAKDNKVYAKKMIAYFKDSVGNNMEIEKVDIFDNVKIVTKDATVFADKGTYFPATGVVKMFDNVSIVREGNKINGDVAEANLNTGVSKLISNKKLGNRIRGIFKEKQKESADEKAK